MVWPELNACFCDSGRRDYAYRLCSYFIRKQPSIKQLSKFRPWHDFYTQH